MTLKFIVSVALSANHKKKFFLFILFHIELGQISITNILYFLDKECTFELDLKYRFTMTCHDPKTWPFWFPVEIDSSGNAVLAENLWHSEDPDRIFDQERFLSVNFSR